MYVHSDRFSLPVFFHEARNEKNDETASSLSLSIYRKEIGY
jgi:hypothetical protein